MRRYHSPVIARMIDSWDGGDPFGSAMSAAWAVAEVARAAGVPEVDTTLSVSWGAVPMIDLGEAADTLTADEPDPGSDISYETAALADAYLSGEITDQDLTFAARVLHRYIDLCERAGISY